MKILLIRPPYTRLRKTGQTPYFPLGLGYISALMIKEGFTVAIYNGDLCSSKDEIPKIDKENIFYSRSYAQKLYFDALEDNKHYVWNEMSHVLKDFEPNIVGLSLLSVEVGSAYKISKIAKKINPEIKVIWGGIHPTFLPKECLKYEEVDYVILGEGEYSFLALVKGINGDKKNVIPSIASLVFKDGYKIQVNPPSAFIQDLDSLTFPARESLLNYKKEQKEIMGSIITSRGCPYRCTFCSSKEFWHRKVRTRSASNVLGEIKTVIDDYDTRFFTFWDDSFSLNHKVIKEICERIIQDKIKISWRTATRADLLDVETLSLMKKSGCFQLELGVETGSKRIAKMIKKDLDLDAVSKSVMLINKTGIASGAFFMAGFPEETKDDLDETFKYMKTLEASEIVLNVFDPMPGSDIYEDMIKSGQLKEPIDWLGFPLWPLTHYVKNVESLVFNQKINEIAEWIFFYNSKLSNRIKHLKPKVLSLMKSAPWLIIKKGFSFFR